MHRRGFTLIEMLVVVTVSSVLMGIAVSLLILLVQAEKMGRNRVRQASVSSQLAGQFRSDVGAAQRHIPAKDEKSAEWQFVLPGDRTVTYRALPREVERTESAFGKAIRQESFALPTGYSAAVVVEPDATPPVASLTLKSDGTPTVGNREIRITAVLGKDHRFAKLPEGSR